MKVLRKGMNTIISVVVFILVLGVGSALAVEVEGDAVLLMDSRSGRVLFAKNIDQPRPVASVTKIMALVLVLENVDRGAISLNDLVSVSSHAASMGGSQVWLEVGEQLPLKEMLYAIAVGSANDAAVAVAEYVAGSEQLFVQEMNARAQQLGLTNTTFSNASGLPPQLVGGGLQEMSARDVAMLARHAMTVPLLMDFVSTYEYTMRAQTTQRPQLWNYNKLLKRYQGVDGIKTGFTTDAGYCLAATAKREGLRLIAIVLGASSSAKREGDIRALLDYGFRKYQDYQVLAVGSEVGEITMRKGEPPNVAGILAEPLSVTVERGSADSVTTEVSFVDHITLPLDVGTHVGVVKAYQDDVELGSVPVTVGERVERGSVFRLILRMSEAMAEALMP